MGPGVFGRSVWDCSVVVGSAVAAGSVQLWWLGDVGRGGWEWWSEVVAGNGGEALLWSTFKVGLVGQVAGSVVDLKVGWSAQMAGSGRPLRSGWSAGRPGVWSTFKVGMVGRVAGSAFDLAVRRYGRPGGRERRFVR